MIQTLRSALVLLALLLVSGKAFAIYPDFTYQGYLEDAGQPANGSYDLQFTLQTLGAGAGENVAGPLLRDNVVVSGGVFTVTLNFGDAIDVYDYQLQIGVRPGASNGSFTALSPPTFLAPAPQARIALLASGVFPNRINSPMIIDGSIASADIADGTIAASDVNTSQIQRRVATGCAANEAIRSINANGTVVCVQGPLGPPGGAEVDFGSLFLVEQDSGDTRNFAVDGGRLALLNFSSIDTSSELNFTNSANNYTVIAVLTAGYYEFRYDITFRATDANPDINLEVFFVSDNSCVTTNLEDATAGHAYSDVSMVLDEQLYYPVSGSTVLYLTALTCVALKAAEIGPQANNEAEMVRGSIIARRIK